MMTTSWKEEGRVEGRLEGRVEGRQEEALALVLRLLSRRIGSLALEQRTQVQQLSLGQLEQLGEDLLDFRTPTDLVQWLQQNP